MPIIVWADGLHLLAEGCHRGCPIVLFRSLHPDTSTDQGGLTSPTTFRSTVIVSNGFLGFLKSTLRFVETHAQKEGA